MDANLVGQQLLQRMEDVARHLYPNGKREGSDWVVGGLDGETGNSMKIRVNGPRTGMFIDHANREDKGGTPLWLWSKARNISFREAIKEAKQFLGLSEEYGLKHHHTKRTFQAPEPTGGRPIIPGKALDYLVITRKIDPTVVGKFRVGESADGLNLIFPYFAEAGDKRACHIKHLQVERDAQGKKKMWASRGTRRCLYGKQTIDESVTSIVICEGEIDALSWATLGIPAVSVPNGVSDMDWIELDWEWLQGFEKIYISMDMDDVGKLAAKDMAKRLGMHRCYLTDLPQKDANACLMAGVTGAEMQKCIDSAELIEPEDLRLAVDYADRAWERFRVNSKQVGIDTPWSGLPWRVRRGEYTVFSGFSGHGKTVMLNHLIVHAIASGWKVLDCSLEVKPDATLKKLIPVAIKKAAPGSREELDNAIAWLGERLWFYDYVGTTGVDKLLQVCDYAIKRYGINLIVIDSLFKCGLSSEDYGAQRVFTDKLTSFCADTGAHIVLVAHARKLENELKPPNKADVAGSSDITNGAHNVLIAWRNKMKNRRLKEAKYEISDPEQKQAIIDEWEHKPDAKLILDKDREDGDEAEVWLWFDHDSHQFSCRGDTPRAYFIDETAKKQEKGTDPF